MASMKPDEGDVLAPPQSNLGLGEDDPIDDDVKELRGGTIAKLQGGAKGKKGMDVVTVLASAWATLVNAWAWVTPWTEEKRAPMERMTMPCTSRDSAVGAGMGDAMQGACLGDASLGADGLDDARQCLGVWLGQCQATSG
ncbi:unnamed protein product, partial [Ilex paraguariensis]